VPIEEGTRRGASVGLLSMESTDLLGLLRIVVRPSFLMPYCHHILRSSLGKLSGQEIGGFFFPLGKIGAS
jgi:hypothetical protein